MQQGPAQLGLKRRGTWPYVRCRLVMSGGFITQPFFKSEVAKQAMRRLVIPRHGKRVFPERFTLAPIRGLNPCSPTKEGNHSCRCSGQNPSAMPGFRQIANQPCQRKIQADLWQICVTVSMRLRTNLDDADDRHKHPQVPEPTCYKIGMRGPQTESAGRNDN